MFGRAALSALTPHFERSGRHAASHEFNDVARRELKLFFNRVETGAVFPRHHDDSIDLGRVKCFEFLFFHDRCRVNIKFSENNKLGVVNPFGGSLAATRLTCGSGNQFRFARDLNTNRIP